MFENKTILENVLLYGTVDVNFETILSVFNLFQKYIHESGRFIGSLKINKIMLIKSIFLYNFKMLY